MKMITEYLADADKFQKMAAKEKDPKLKSALEKQAAAYWKLAEERSKKLGVPMPKKPPQSN
jgi:hypothetical protein